MYFSGFSLKDEKELFKEYIVENDYSVSGFSYGAIKAFEYVLNSNDRIDLLQLFSPAFFNDKDKKYKRMQLMFFKKDSALYCDNFLVNCGFDDEKKDKYFSMGSFDELEELLYYTWDKKKLVRLKEKGVNIEVYLGSKDKIIDSSKALEFFRPFGDIYFIKDKRHIL